MTYLDLKVSQILEMTPTDATIDATASPSVPSTKYDAAFYFAGDFLTGNFIQDSADIDSIKSTLALSQDGFNASHAFLLDSGAVAGSGGRSTYANSATTQKALRVTATTYDNMVVGGSALNIDTYVHINGAEAIPMISQAGTLPSGDLAASNTGVGESLLNAVSQALFKRMGKNAAINNDVSLKSDLQDKLFVAINDAVGEVDASYNDSKYFKRYLDSGRYADHTSELVNQRKTYTVANTVIHALVKITGNVADSSTSPDLGNSAVSERIFGVNQVDTLVGSGVYETHILVALRQDNRL